MIQNISGLFPDIMLIIIGTVLTACIVVLMIFSTLENLRSQRVLNSHKEYLAMLDGIRRTHETPRANRENRTVEHTILSGSVEKEDGINQDTEEDIP